MVVVGIGRSTKQIRSVINAVRTAKKTIADLGDPLGVELIGYPDITVALFPLLTLMNALRLGL